MISVGINSFPLFATKLSCQESDSEIENCQNVSIEAKSNRSPLLSALCKLNV